MLFINKLFNSFACLLSFINLQLVIPGRTWILLYLGRTVYKRLWACLALYNYSTLLVTDIIFDVWHCNPRHLELTSQLLLLSGEVTWVIFTARQRGGEGNVFSRVCLYSVCSQGVAVQGPGPSPPLYRPLVPPLPDTIKACSTWTTLSIPAPTPCQTRHRGKFPINAV